MDSLFCHWQGVGPVAVRVPIGGIGQRHLRSHRRGEPLRRHHFWSLHGVRSLSRPRRPPTRWNRYLSLSVHHHHGNSPHIWPSNWQMLTFEPRFWAISTLNCQHFYKFWSNPPISTLNNQDFNRFRSNSNILTLNYQNFNKFWSNSSKLTLNNRNFNKF